MDWSWLNQKNGSKRQGQSTTGGENRHQQRKTFILEEIITPSAALPIADLDANLCPVDGGVNISLGDGLPPIFTGEELGIEYLIPDLSPGNFDDIVPDAIPDAPSLTPELIDELIGTNPDIDTQEFIDLSETLDELNSWGAIANIDYTPSISDQIQILEALETLPQPIIIPVDPPSAAPILGDNNPINDFPEVRQPEEDNNSVNLAPETLASLNQDLSQLKSLLDQNSSASLLEILYTEEAAEAVGRIDEIIASNPDLIERLSQPDTLDKAGIDPNNIQVIKEFLNDGEVAELMGLPVSLGEALSNPDSTVFDQFLLNADRAYDLLPSDAQQPAVGIIDFAENQHSQNVNDIFTSINPLAKPQNYTVKNNDWAAELVNYVNQLKSQGKTQGIVNLSFDLSQVDDISVTTRYELTSEEVSALQYAKDHNILVIAAAGNTGGAMSALGKASQEFDNLITVGAINQFQAKTDYSAYGNGLTLVAPGGSWEDDPDAFVGTSRSTSYVTAAASLVWAANPDLSWLQVKNLLIETARDLNIEGWDAETGAGLVDIQEAVIRAQMIAPQATPESTQVIVPEFGGLGRVEMLARPAGENTQDAVASLTDTQQELLAQWQTLVDLGNPDFELDELKAIVDEQIDQALIAYQGVSTDQAVAKVEIEQIQEALQLAISHYQIEQERLNLLQTQKQELEEKLTNLGEQKTALEAETQQLLESIQEQISQAEADLEAAKAKLINPFADVNQNMSLNSASIYQAATAQDTTSNTFNANAQIQASEAERFTNLANSINPMRWQVVGWNKSFSGRKKPIYGWKADPSLLKQKQQYQWQASIASNNANALNTLSQGAETSAEILNNYGQFIDNQTDRVTESITTEDEALKIVEFLEQQIEHQESVAQQYINLATEAEKRRAQNQARANWHHSLINGQTYQFCGKTIQLHYPEHIPPYHQAQHQANLALNDRKSYTNLAQQADAETSKLREQLRKVKERLADWSSLKQGIEYEIAAQELRLQAEQDLLAMHTPVQEQKLETLDLLIQQTQADLDRLIAEKLPNQQQLTDATEQRWQETQAEANLKQTAYSEAQENLENFLEFSGFLLPNRERLSAIKKQIEQIEAEKLNTQFAIQELTQLLIQSPSEVGSQQLQQWADYLEQLDQHLNWANIQKDQLTLAIADSPERLEIAALIKALEDDNMPTWLKDKIDNLKALEGGGANFLQGFDDLEERLAAATTEQAQAEQALPVLQEEYRNLGLEKSNLEGNLIPAKEEQIEGTEEAIAQTEVTLATLESQLSGLQTSQGQKTVEVANQEAVVAATQAEIQPQVDNIKNQVADQNTQIQQLQAEANSYQTQINQAVAAAKYHEQQRQNHQNSANYWNGQIGIYNEAAYLAHNKDVAYHVWVLGWLRSGWEHYLRWGRFEGRLPNPQALVNRNAAQNAANQNAQARDANSVRSQQLTVTLQEIQQQINEINQQKNSLIQEQEGLQNQLDVQQTTLQQLEQELETITQETEGVQEHIEQQQQTLEELNDLSLQEQEQLADLEAQVSLMDQQLIDKYREIELTEKYLSVMVDEESRLQSRLDLLNQAGIIDRQYTENWQQWQQNNQTLQDLKNQLLTIRDNSQPDRDILAGFETDLNTVNQQLEEANGLQNLIDETNKDIELTNLQIGNRRLQLQALIGRDAPLASAQANYNSSAQYHQQRIWSFNGRQWVYNAGEAAAYRYYLQKASFIVDERNDLWQQRTETQEKINELQTQLGEQQSQIATAKQELNDLGGMVDLQNTSHYLNTQINTVKQRLQPLEEQEIQLLESLQIATEESQNNLNELTQTSTLQDTALQQLIGFGVLASESDVDFFATEVQPQVESFLEKLQQRLTALEQQMADNEALNNDYTEQLRSTVDPVLQDTQINLIQQNQIANNQLQELRDDTQQNIEDLTQLLQKANDALLPVRQKQELEIREKLETNATRFDALESLLNTEQMAELAVENDTVLDYVELRNQVQKDLSDGVQNWTQLLLDSYQQTKDLGNRHQDLSASVDELIADIDQNLADPQGEYEGAKLVLGEGIATLGVLENRADELDLTVDSTEDAIEQIKLRIQQDAELWEEIAPIAIRYGVESEELEEYQNQLQNIFDSETQEIAEKVEPLRTEATRLQQQALSAYNRSHKQGPTYSWKQTVWVPLTIQNLRSFPGSVWTWDRVRGSGSWQTVTRTATDANYIQYQQLTQQATTLKQQANELEEQIKTETKNETITLRENFVQTHPQNGTTIDLLQDVTFNGSTPDTYLDSLYASTTANVLLNAQAVEGRNPNEILFNKATSAKTNHEAQGHALLAQAAWYERQAAYHWNRSRKNGPYWYEERWVKTRKGGHIETITHIDHHWIVWQQYSQIFPQLRQQGYNHLAAATKWEKVVDRIEPLKDQWVAANDAANTAEPAITEARDLFAQLETAHESITADQIQLETLENLLPTIQEQLQQAVEEAEAQNAKVNEQWEDYDVNSEEYINAVTDILNQRGELNQKSIAMQQEIAEAEKWVERQSVALSTELENTKALLTQLQEQQQSFNDQLLVVIGDEADDIKTKLAQLEPAILQLNNKATILTTQQTALTQKRTLLTAQNEVILAEQRLLDAYVKDPDADHENLAKLLNDSRAALAEAQRLAEQAEAASQALTAPLQELQRDLLAQNDEHLQQARSASQLLKDLVEATQANQNYALQVAQKQQQVNDLELQILQRLQTATAAGNQEAKHLLDVAQYNDMATAAELYYRDYSDLASDRGGGCSGGGVATANDRILADNYYREMLTYRHLQNQAQAQVNAFRHAKETAQAQMRTLEAQQTSAFNELQRLQDELNQASENREQLEQEYAIAQTRLEGITRIREQTEQTFNQLITLEQLNLAQAELEREIADNRQGAIDEAVQARYERDSLELERKRLETTARLEQLRQLQAEDELRNALNNARGQLGVETLEATENPLELQTQLAGLLVGLQQLQQQNPEFPDDLKALLDETNGDIHAALQGEESETIQQNLLNAMSGLIGQIDVYKTEINRLDLEEQWDNELLQTAQLDLQKASQDLLKELERSAVLGEERDVINPLYLEVLNKVALAEQAVDISEDLASQSKDIFEQIIKQRIEQRKARKKAFWNKVLGIISQVTGILSTILFILTPVVPVLMPLSIGLGAVSGAINTIQAVVNGDWLGAIFSGVMTGLTAITGGMTQALGESAKAVQMMKTLQTIASGAFSGARSLMSGDSIMGFLQILGSVASAALAGMMNFINQCSGTLKKVMLSMVQSLQQAPQMIYGGIKAIQDGDWLNAIGNIFNAALSIGQSFAGNFNQAVAGILEKVSNVGNTALILGGAIKDGGIESWLSGINGILNIWKDDLKGLVDEISAKEEVNKLISEESDPSAEKNLDEELEDETDDLYGLSEDEDVLDSVLGEDSQPNSQVPEGYDLSPDLVAWLNEHPGYLISGDLKDQKLLEIFKNGLSLRDHSMPEIKYLENASSSVVSDYTLEVLRDALRVSDNDSATITSTTRSPYDQARVMFDNLENYGIEKQKELYGSAGDQVINIYKNGKQRKLSRENIIKNMKNKITNIGPQSVSRHAADPKKLNVIDVAPNSLKNRKKFIDALKNDKRVSKVLTPNDGDPAFHIEIPQP